MENCISVLYPTSLHIVYYVCVRAAAAKQSCTSRRLFLSLLQTTTPSATALSFFASAQEKRRWCSVHTYTTTMNFYSSPLLTKQIRQLMDMTTLTVEVSDYTVVGKQPKSVSFLFSKIFWVIFTIYKALKVSAEL